MRIAVIPARGGSRRITLKYSNVFHGKPMIAWVIETAQAAGLFDHVVVSTDDAEVAAAAVRYGAECPFVRPPELSDDHATTGDVVAHATRWALGEGWTVETVCCLYATAPFIRVADLKQGLELLDSGNWQYAFAATDFAAPIFRAFSQQSDGGVEMFFPEHHSTRSQDLPRALHDAGQFYWGRASAWTEGLRLFDRWSVPVFIPRWRVQDIDEPDDWTRAEAIFKQLRESRT